MNSFLCPNSSLIPSYKYFGIFEDIKNAKEYDWSGYILDWLLEGIKSFNRAKSIRRFDSGTLAGCLYYLAVIYLDFVDFGVRQVPDSVLRISVWKGGMIRNYVEFDMKSPGCYGYHPLLDLSRTCYSKDLRYLYNPNSLTLDSDFNDKLESYSGCKLLVTLKTNIASSFRIIASIVGFSVNLDVNSINALPDDLKITFCKLLKHAYSINSRTEKLVLDLIKLVADSCVDDDLGKTPDDIPPTQHAASQQGVHGNTRAHDSDRGNPVNTELDGDDPVYCSQYEVHNSSPDSSLVHNHNLGQVQCSPCGTTDTSVEDYKRSLPLPVPNLSRSASKTSNLNFDNDGVARVMQKLTRNNNATPSPTYKTPSRFVPSASGYPSNHGLYRTLSQNLGGTHAKIREPDNRNPLGGSTYYGQSKRLKKSVSFGGQGHSNNDVIMLDNDNYYVPDSVSPSPRHGLYRLFSQKSGSAKENMPPAVSQMTPIVMQTLEFTSHTSPRITSNVLKGSRDFSSKLNPQPDLTHSRLHQKVCPDVEIIAERTLADSVRVMTQKYDDIYNSNLRSSGLNLTTPNAVHPCGPSGSRPSYDNNSHSQPFRASNSTTGGKLPLHGP